MTTFIQVTEVWRPTADRTMLEYADGLYGAHQRFARISRALCFGYGEGLPGRAWEERRPVLTRDLQGDWFRRADAAAEAGLTCAVAVPLFAGEFLLAVLVFFCGGAGEQVGAIELWHQNTADAAALTLRDGYFGIAESFEWTARNTEFLVGFGLPGMAWQSGVPEIVDDLGHSSRFVRRDDARRVGLTKGLALPFLDQPGGVQVLTFLSALGTPIARRFEVWCPDETGRALRLRGGACDTRPSFADGLSKVALDKGGSLLGLAWASGLPAVSSDISSENSPVAASARSAGLAAAVAIPALRHGRLQAVVALYF